MSDHEMIEAEKAARLTALKTQADLMGINYSGNIGEEALSKRIQEHKESQGVVVAEAPTLNIGEKTLQQLEGEYAVFRAKQRIRISINCVNPAKAELVGDIYTVYSSSLGKVQQWIPYQAPEGYHVPRCLVDLLKEKKFLSFRPVKIDKSVGGVDREHVQMNEFIIRELPPVTFEEYKRIVERQDRQQSVRIED